MHRPMDLVGIGLFLIAVALPSAAGTQEPFLYGLNLTGRLTVNGTTLENLPSDFDDDTNDEFWEAYQALAVDGADRWALRRNGALFKNGVRVKNLKWGGDFDDDWVGLAAGGGSSFALRRDGRIAVDDSIEANLPKGDYFFHQILWRDGVTYSLRSNGNVYENGDDTPLIKFRGRRGVYGEKDGDEVDTVWIALVADPASDYLYALRSDGTVMRADPAFVPEPGEENFGVDVATLPFADAPLRRNDFYVDLAITDSGDWKVLRANGKVFDALHTRTELVNLPGNGGERDTLYTDIATLGEDFWSIRGDGRVYRNTDTEEILNLPADDYVELEIGTEPPDLSNIKNAKPVTAVYKTKTIVGTPLAIPVLATDTDKRSEDLIVELVEAPPGAVWDAETRTLSWDSPGPAGSYDFVVTVDDGVAKPVKVKHKLKLLEPDAKPEKNKPPLVSKVSKVQALIGAPLALPLVFDDPDGDELSVRIDTLTYPFNQGAVFDPSSSTFLWTPRLEDQGKVQIPFEVSDGTKTKTLKLKLEVVGALTF